MALASSIVWEVRTTGAVTNGGGYKPGSTGTDYSQQAAAQYALTGVTTAAANAILLSANAAADMVGNVLYIASGTNFTVGWYEILSVSVGVSITVDRTCCTAAGSAGVVNIGGAMIIAASSVWASALVAGNKVWIKAGTYSATQAHSFTSGSSTLPITLEGYNSARGDFPTGSTRPIFSQAANNFTYGSNNIIKYIQHTGTAAQVVISGAGNQIYFCKFTNTSTTTGRAALYSQGQTLVQNTEGISYRGRAFETQGVFTAYTGCYAHDSDIGIYNNSAGSAIVIISHCLIESNVTNAIKSGTGSGSIHHVFNNTIYGSEAKTGVGFLVATGLTDVRFWNNIVYGFTTGISHADANNICWADYNTYNNNTANRTNYLTGDHDIALAPSFTLVAQKTGTAATTSGSVLTDAAANFSTVTDNVDFCYIASGTGITAGQYLITSHTTTTLTLDIAPGTSAVADKVYQVTTGRNFSIGTNLQAQGTPGVFATGTTTSYMDLGAVQRRIDVPATTDTKSGVVYDNSLKTGSYVATGGGSYTSA